MSARAHAERVVRKGVRPKPDRSWPLNWVDVMTRAWDPDSTKRPDFDEIANFLDIEVENMEGNGGELPSRTTDIKAKKKIKKTLFQLPTPCLICQMTAQWIRKMED